ncbi:MAG TPA: transposase [Ktedonobacterales bacterium]|jgi:putative transposase|nr:transposase [Ktedonobacterales bacterium]
MAKARGLRAARQVAADGTLVANPRHYRAAACHLARAQRRVSRRTLGNNRRRKAVRLLSKAHQRVRRTRQDFHHKAALALVRQYDTIFHEDLQTANMVKNSHLTKSISDVGWSASLSILSFKAACAGRSVVAVPPVSTSQDCSGCGERMPKNLSVRTHVCPSCGLVLGRDENAAPNILRLGQSRQARTWSAEASVA